MKGILAQPLRCAPPALVLTRTFHELIYGPRFPRSPRLCRRTLPIRLHAPVTTCFLGLKFTNLKGLALISFCLARTREVFNAGPLGQTGCAMQPKFEFPLLLCRRLDSR